MCQARIWLRCKNEEKEWVRDITQLEVQGGEIVLKTFFEPPRRIKGRIASIDFLKAKVIIECDAFPE